MLNLPKCVVKQSSTFPVSETVSILEEGTALISILESGLQVVKASTGVAGERFVGVAQNRHTAPEYAPMFENLSVPGSSPYTRKLAKLPYGTERGFTINGAVATVVTSGTPTSGQVLVDSQGNLTFAAADAGKAVTALYRYALTQTEAAFQFGYDIPFMRVPGVETSVIEVGRVFTDRYVLSDNWAATDAMVYLGADGKFTTDDTGSLVGHVSALPSVAGGFLGIDVSV